MWILTVAEYTASPLWRRIAYRLYRNPHVLFGVGPIGVFLIQYRFNRQGAKRKERMNNNLTNALLVGSYVLMVWAIGWQALLMIEGPIFLISGSLGIYRSHPELAQRVVNDIHECGGIAFAFCADVSNEVEVQAMVDETVRRYGTVDILVNNTGMDPRKTWYEITAEEWDYIMGINVRSQFLCAKAVFPHMESKGHGKIINVSSVTFFTGQKNYIHYVTSKADIVGFTRALAREVGENHISVNCITPGAVYTETEAESRPRSIECSRRCAC